MTETLDADARLGLIYAPIDATSRNGECWAVRAPGQRPAVARYSLGGWYFVSGLQLDFQPTEYLRRCV